MDYNVKLTYMDDKTQDIIIPEDRLGSFKRCLDEKDIYWFTFEGNKVGFWADMKNIRHVLFNEVTGPPPKKEEEDTKDPDISEHVSPDPEKEVVPE